MFLNCILYLQAAWWLLPTPKKHAGRRTLHTVGVCVCVCEQEMAAVAARCVLFFNAVLAVIIFVYIPTHYLFIQNNIQLI